MPDGLCVGSPGPRPLCQGLIRDSIQPPSRWSSFALKSFAPTFVSLLILLLVPGAAKASDPPTETQPRTSTNAVYADLLGEGMLYSVNYERIFLDSVALRVGASYLPFSFVTTSGASVDAESYHLLTFPVTLSWVGLYSGKHGLEVGGGATMISTIGTPPSGSIAADGDQVLGTIHVGYRIQPPDSGFLFRVGALGMFGRSTVSSPQFIIVPSIYLSFGYAFGDSR